MEFTYCFDEEEFEYKVSCERVYLEAAKILYPQLSKENLELAVTTIQKMALYMDDEKDFFTYMGVADVFESEAINWYREGKEAEEELKLGYYRSVL